jgi:hypothetical protein
MNTLLVGMILSIDTQKKLFLISPYSVAAFWMLTAVGCCDGNLAVRGESGALLQEK